MFIYIVILFILIYHIIVFNISAIIVGYISPLLLVLWKIVVVIFIYICKNYFLLKYAAQKKRQVDSRHG